MIQLFYVGMNNYPFNFVQLPSYLLPAMATDFTLVLFGLRKHMGLYVLISCFLAGVLVVPGHFLFLNVPFLLTNVVYPDPLNAATNHVMPMWSVIRMVIPKAPIPAYIAEQFTWPLPYRSFYDPYIIMTGFMGIMGVVWSGFTYIFLKAIFYAIGKTTKHFVEPAGGGRHGPSHPPCRPPRVVRDPSGPRPARAHTPDELARDLHGRNTGGDQRRRRRLSDDHAVDGRLPLHHVELPIHRWRRRAWRPFLDHPPRPRLWDGGSLH